LTLSRTAIDLVRLRLPVVGAWKERQFLLAAGDFASGSYNLMTVGWGGLGRMWARPMALITVRPSRYTYTFLQKHRDFTLNLFPASFADTLSYCGNHSGRDVDKVKETGLTPIASQKVTAPGFQQAELILECRVSYFSDFDPGRFLADYIEGHYPNKDYHRLFLGEILAASGTASFAE
jgi:flavin reductase (DIM6/NTAB) family NADH-FMN oxidoreductase RutF